MAAAYDYPAWIFLMLGVYSLGAGWGELIKPGFWLGMVRDLENSNALRFLTGIICLSIGTALYLIGPWASDDRLLNIIKIIGGMMIFEGFIFLSFGEKMLKLSRYMMERNTRLWAGVSMAFGVIAIIFSTLRISGAV